MERPSIQKSILRRSQEKGKTKNRDDGNREVFHTKVHSSRSKTKKNCYEENKEVLHTIEHFQEK
jgi:hypothetical protein